MKEESKAQRRANARNQLFRQIHGFSLTAFLIRAVRENAITNKEYIAINSIMNSIEHLKRHKFENSKILGFNPRRRCHLCNGIEIGRAHV